MEAADVKQEIIDAEIQSAFIDGNPAPFMAVRLTTESLQGEKNILPWMALSSATAERLARLIQQSPAHGAPPAQPPVRH